MLRSRRAGFAVCAALVLSSIPSMVLQTAAAAAAPVRQSALRHLLLVRTDLPPGWKETVPSNVVTTRLGCGGGVTAAGKGWHHAVAVYANGKGLPFVSDAVATGPDVEKTWLAVSGELSGCRSASITVDGKSHRATIRPLPFNGGPTDAGSTVVATQWALEATGLGISVDAASFREKQVIGVVSYTDVGTADTVNFQAFADAAIARAAGHAGAVKGVVTVATSPVRVTRTTDGKVAYRKVGSGPPLVLVMGYGASMEAWEPQFVDDLAHRFTVVMFDNAGIGKTSSLRSPLTIDAMAQQTSALISALHLGATDVLGWSMGGLLAEALAVLHPSQVRRLVLCATYPGTGAVRPPQARVDDLNAGGSKALSVLFPPGHTVAASVYTAANSAYLRSASTPASVIASQASAVLEAWAGTDPALRRYRAITSPTLVSDGSLDRLVPPQNARALAAGIAGSKLILYKGAGHAFLFQDLGTFVPAVESFLSS